MTRFLLATLLLTCALGAAAQVPRDHPPIVQAPVTVLQLPDPSSLADFRVQVRGVSAADKAVLEHLRDETRSLVGSSLGISAVSLVEAFAMPSFWSGSLIAGAVFLTPLAITIGVVEKRQRETVQRVLQETPLIEHVRQAVQRRHPDATMAGEASATLEVVIVGYGLTRDPVCVFADAAIRLTVDGRMVYEDLVYIEPFLRSADAPPPVCRSIEAFAANDGKLLHDALVEYGQVIAAIVVRRTGALPW